MATEALKGFVSLSIPNSDEYLYFNWSVTGQEGMNSIISWNLTSDYRSVWYKSSFSGEYSVTINGTKLTSLSSFTEAAIPSGTSKRETVLKSGTYKLARSLATNTAAFNVVLTAAGTLTRQKYGQGSDGKPNSSIVETKTFTHNTSASKEYVVYSTTQPGAGAQITAISNFTDETSPVISYTYDRGTTVNSVTLEVGIAFNGDNIVIPYRAISPTENTYTFNFTQSDLTTLYTLLANGETAALRFYIRTTETLVNGEILTALSDPFVKTFNFVNYKPLINPTLTDLNDATFALTGNRNHLVRYFSKVSYNMNVELRKGALDVIGCYIQNGDRIEEGFTSGTFDNPTTNVFYFSATDDRGYTGTASKSLSLFDGEFINYIKLSSSLKSSPIGTDGDISITITGKYFNANFGVAQNKLDVQYAIYKKGTTPSWKTIQNITPVMTDNETYTYTFSDTGLDYTAQYIVAVRVSDLLMTSESSISVVAKPVFYWNNDEFIFNVPVKFSDNSSPETVIEEKTVAGYYMNSSGQYTSGGYSWTYRKWSSGLLECWCSIPISTTVNTAWGNMYVAAVSNIYKTDLSYPVQPTATPNITVTLGAGATKGMLIADNSYAADNVSTGRYNIASPVSITSSTTFRLNYYVRGKWK